LLRPIAQRPIGKDNGHLRRRRRRRGRPREPNHSAERRQMRRSHSGLWLRRQRRASWASCGYKWSRAFSPCDGLRRDGNGRRDFRCDGLNDGGSLCRRDDLCGCIGGFRLCHDGDLLRRRRLHNGGGALRRDDDNRRCYRGLDHSLRLWLLRQLRMRRRQLRRLRLRHLYSRR
jgi:hypothetical protein